MTAALSAKTPRLAPGSLPVVGHLPLILRSRFDFIDAAGSVKPVSRVKFGPKTAYFVNDHELLQQILVSDADKFVRGIHFKKMKNMVGNGVVTTSGDLHRRQRRTMLPSFSQRRLALSLPIIRKLIAQFVDSIPEGRPYDLMPPLMAVGCDITATTLFGEGCPGEVLDLVREAIPVFVSNAAIHAVDVTGIYKHLPTRSNKNFRRLLDEFNGYLYSVIDERMARGDDQKVGDERDLLGMLIRATDPETGEKFSRTEVRDQSATVMFASTETTANTVCWAAYELARHPRIFQRCREEVDALVNGSGVGEIEIGRDDLPTVKRAIMEALRLYPSSYLLSRQTARDVELGGYAIPANATILYSHYGQQRDEANFSHADEFDPDRWLDKNGSEITPGAYMPFGYGAYRCMGESVATLEAIYYIAMLVHQWDFRLDEQALPKMNATITLSAHDMNLVFTKRKFEAKP